MSLKRWCGGKNGQTRFLQIYVEERFLRWLQENGRNRYREVIGEKSQDPVKRDLVKVCGALSVKLKVKWGHGKEEVKRKGYIQVTRMQQDWGKNYFQTNTSLLIFPIKKFVLRTKLTAKVYYKLLIIEIWVNFFYYGN